MQLHKHSLLVYSIQADIYVDNIWNVFLNTPAKNNWWEREKTSWLPALLMLNHRTGEFIIPFMFLEIFPL